MTRAEVVRAILMAAEIRDGVRGFHRLLFRVQGGRNSGRNVTVLISQDAYLKLTGQMARARVQHMDKLSLLTRWARWELTQRLDAGDVLPDMLAFTSSDLDDLGAYTWGLSLQIEHDLKLAVAGPRRRRTRGIGRRLPPPPSPRPR